MTLKSRKRDFCHDREESPNGLTWTMTDHPFRWLPKQGAPSSVWELISQTIVKVIAWLPVYIAIIVTIVLLLQLHVLSVF